MRQFPDRRIYAQNDDCHAADKRDRAFACVQRIRHRGSDDGRFQSVDRLTLFLDEIGDLLLELHPKLLRALQEKQVERLGAAIPFKPTRG
jgi:hypothetical protein